MAGEILYGNYASNSHTDAVYSFLKAGNKNLVLFLPRLSDGYSVSQRLCESPPEGIKKVIYTCLDRQSFLYTPSMKPYTIDTMLKYSLTRHLLKDETKVCGPGNYISDFEASLSADTLLVIDGYDIASASPYLRHLFTLDCCILVITNKETKSKEQNVLYLGGSTSSCAQCLHHPLNPCQQELLTTLCAFMLHLDDSLVIISSTSGVFNAEAVRFYLGDLANELGYLEDCGYIKTMSDGRIVIDRDIRDHVLSTYSPDAALCKRFMEFCAAACNSGIYRRDILYVPTSDIIPEKYASVATSGELLCLYTHFIESDPRGIIRLYNLLMLYIQENFSTQKGVLFKNHLLMKNVPYYISLLSRHIHENYSEIYCDNLTDEICYETYSSLDIIRLCICFIRNMTPDMYKRNKAVLECLSEELERIITFCDSPDYTLDEKISLLDDTIELCCESFSFFSIVNDGGLLNKSHLDYEFRRICYTTEKETDRLFADSLVFGYNSLTVKLYVEYCALLDKWLSLYDKYDNSDDIQLIKQLNKDNIYQRRHTCNLIKSHFCRLSRGLDVFTDVQSERYFTDDIFKCTYSEAFEKRLEDNIHLSKKGYDRSTLLGAKRHCESVLLELSKSNNPCETILPVLSPFYPVSQHFYETLANAGVVRICCDNEKTTNRSLEILLESLIFQYPDCIGNHRLCDIYKEFIERILPSAYQNSSCIERIYRYVSSMYVRCALNDDVRDILFEDSLFNRCCIETEITPTYCDEYIAGAIYCKKFGQKLPFSKANLLKAINIFSKENPDFDGCSEILTKYIFS